MDLKESIIAKARHACKPDNEYHGEIGALRLAREYGSALADIGESAVAEINKSYNDVCIPIYGDNPPVDEDRWTFAVRDAWSWRLSDINMEEEKMNENKSKKRMKLVLATVEAVNAFMNVMSKQDDEYLLENETGSIRVSAKSQIGVLYMTTEIGNSFFLVNMTHDGMFPDMLSVDGYHQF